MWVLPISVDLPHIIPDMRRRDKVDSIPDISAGIHNFDRIKIGTYFINEKTLSRLCQLRAGSNGSKNNVIAS